MKEEDEGQMIPPGRGSVPDFHGYSWGRWSTLDVTTLMTLSSGKLSSSPQVTVFTVLSALHNGRNIRSFMSLGEKLRQRGEVTCCSSPRQGRGRGGI